MQSGDRSSATPARVDDHLLVVLEHDVVVVVDVQHRHGAELGRYAARSRRHARVHRVDERLHDGVVGRVEVVGQVERTVAGAVERLVAGRCHDPVVPPDLAEVDVQRPPPAEVPTSAAMLATAPRPRSRPAASLGVPPAPRLASGRGGPRRPKSPAGAGEVGRRAGHRVGAVGHQMRPLTADRRRPVDPCPDDHETQVPLRSTTPSGDGAGDDEGGPLGTGGFPASAAVGHRSLAADESQVPGPDGGVVQPAVTALQRPGRPVYGHQLRRRGGPVVGDGVELDVEVKFGAVGSLGRRDLGQVESDACHSLRQ